MVNQLEEMDKEVYRSFPLSGEALAARVQVQITSGLRDLNKLVKQATVRRHIVEQLIRMWRDRGHPDYQGAFRDRSFFQRLHYLSPTSEESLYIFLFLSLSLSLAVSSVFFTFSTLSFTGGGFPSTTTSFK